MDGFMLALVKHHPGEGAQIQYVEIPEDLAPDEVLIEVKATSICGTDVHIYTWDDWAKSRVKPPYVFGHEFGGVVVKTGSAVRHVKVGDHVSAETHIVCGHCNACRRGDAHVCLHTQIIGVDSAGCFTKYIKLPATNVWINSQQLSFETASIMEPMGNAVHTVLSGEIAGKSVAIVGCGPIGLMAVAVSKASGASRVIALDVNDYRLELAEAMGATDIIRSHRVDPVREILGITRGDGVEVVLEMSGHPVAMQQAFAMVTPGGRISILSLPTHPISIDITNHIVFKGITVKGITGRRMYETWQQVANFLESGQIDLTPLITHRLSLEEYEYGFELMKNGKCGKIVFLMD